MTKRALIKTYAHGKQPIVYVRWVDSTTTSGWGQTAADDHEPVTCETAGFLLKTRPSHVTIAQNRGPTKCGEVTSIPMVCVKSIRQLK